MTFDETIKAAVIRSWFDDYDMQVREYERDVRLGRTPDIHIGDKTYATISDLDAEAVVKAAELKTLEGKGSEDKGSEDAVIRKGVIL